MDAVLSRRVEVLEMINEAVLSKRDDIWEIYFVRSDKYIIGGKYLYLEDTRYWKVIIILEGGGVIILTRN